MILCEPALPLRADPAWIQPMTVIGCQVLADMMRDNRAVGRSGRVYDSLAELSTRRNLETLQRLMIELRPKHTLEIGLSFGGSALTFCAAHRTLDGGTHVALDPFQSTVWDSVGIDAVNRSGLSTHLDFRETYSAIELPKMLERGERFGLIYVDGSHLFEDVFIDAYYGSRLLEPNGVIAFDDCSDPHVAKVIAFLRTNTAMREIDLNFGRRNPAIYSAAKRLNRVQMRAFRRTNSTDREWNAKFIPF
jgi:predicted O-methyltransferase YrrM